jgi:hypothetical protein
LGHSLLTHSASASTNVRCCSNSGQTRVRRNCPLSARSGCQRLTTGASVRSMLLCYAAPHCALHTLRKIFREYDDSNHWWGVRFCHQRLRLCKRRRWSRDRSRSRLPSLTEGADMLSITQSRICASAVASTREVAMRNALIFALTPIALMSMVALSTPAAATKLGQAQKICAGNPNCMGMKCSHGDWCACTDSGCVSCPKKGNCVVLRKDGTPMRGTITSVLQPPHGGNPPSGGGTPPSGGLLDQSPGFSPQGPASSGGRRGTPSGGTGTIY